MKDDLISRQNAIDAHCELCGDRGRCNCDICPDMEVFQLLPSVQPKSFDDKLKEIADALSEKMCYMNTCLNERDIILGYLGVKRPNVCHCDTDCNNYRCESYHYDTKKYLELSDDTISRQAAIDAIRNNVFAVTPTQIDTKIDCIECVGASPSVQAERKTAKWIATTSLQEGQITWKDYKCSNCSHHRRKPMNFCEVCGRKMER